jgi:hypothetical protein
MAGECVMLVSYVIQQLLNRRAPREELQLLQSNLRHLLLAAAAESQ